MIRFRALGPVELAGADGQTLDAVLAQPKRLAVLAYLAIGLAGQFRRRDTIIAYLWPELDAERARAALRQALHFLRQSLGPEALKRRGDEELGLNGELFWCDVTAFSQACDEAQASRALELYRGDLLSGFFVTGAAPEFEHWLDSERDRLRRQASAAARMATDEAMAAGQHAAAEQFARRAVHLAPADEGALRRLISVLDDLGDRSGALRAYDDFARRLAQEFDAEPSAETKALIGAVRARATPLASSTRAPEPVRATQRASDGHGRRPTTRVAWIALALAMGTSALLVESRGHASAVPVVASDTVRLAVLPFENVGDTANAYIADGVADEIRGKLSALPGVRLIASASSNQYRNTPKAARQIGAELGVRYLLIGRVQWEVGSSAVRRVRVSPELIEVRDDAPPETRWQESYDGTLDDIFDLQTTVATEIADKLGLVLSPKSQQQLAAQPTRSLAAYEAYLRSTALVGDDPPTIRAALAAAKRAVTLDSTFVAAWARLSARYAVLFVAATPKRAYADSARMAAERAIALNPNAANGYVARGVYEYYDIGDIDGARVAFAMAHQLDPSSSEARGGLALAEAALGHWSEALAHFRQAAALDPRSADASDDLANFLVNARRYPEGQAEAERGLAFAPADIDLIESRATCLLAQGQLGAAKAALRDVPPTLDRAKLIANVASSSGISWALDSADQALALRLPPSAFAEDRGTWGLVRARLYWWAGDSVRARRFADTAQQAYAKRLEVTPEDFSQHLFRGMALAYMGRRADAELEGARGLALALPTRDGYATIPWARHHLARLYVVAGDTRRAVGQLDTLLATPNVESPARLRVDPTWAPLRGDSAFERLAAQPATRF